MAAVCFIVSLIALLLASFSQDSCIVNIGIFGIGLSIVMLIYSFVTDASARKAGNAMRQAELREQKERERRTRQILDEYVDK